MLIAILNKLRDARESDRTGVSSDLSLLYCLFRMSHPVLVVLGMFAIFDTICLKKK